MPTKKTLFFSTSLLAVAVSHANFATAESSSNSIEEVSVYGQRLNTETATGSRLSLTILETPATLDIISGNSIRSRIDLTVLDAATRSAGFTSEATPGNGGQSIAARGFRGQGAVTKLFDGTSYFNAFGTITFPFDTWGVERIEILKGPSSVMYGEGGIGGAINVIPKRPKFEQEGALRASVGQNNTQFFGLSATSGLTDSLAARIDYSKSQSDNWVSNGESESEMLSLALLWEVSSDFRLNLRYDRGDQEPMRYFGIPVENGDFARRFLDDNFEVSDGEIRYEDQAIRLKAEWDISESIAMNAELYHLETDRFWRTVEGSSVIPEGLPNAGFIRRSDPLIIGHEMDHDGFRVNFSFANTLGGMEINSSAGFEINEVSFDRPTNFGRGNPNRVDFTNDFDVVDPNNFNPGLYSDVTDAVVGVDDVFSDLSQFALFGESQIKFTNQLALVLGLRYEDAETDYRQVGVGSFDQSVDVVTGRAGLVYDINDGTAIYGQYTTGATHPSDSLVRAVASRQDADFIETEQYELGLKQQLLDGRVRWSVALFDIVRNNLSEDDPTSSNPNDRVFIDEQTSQGIEFSVDVQVNDALQVYANGTVLDAEMGDGNTTRLVPEESANLGFTWAPLEQLSFIADARYVGKREDAVDLPSYSVVDASAKYEVNKDFSLTFKLDNAFDEVYASAAYYTGNWLVGKRRTFSVTADYSF